VFGCLGVWVFGCLGVWVFGCLDLPLVSAAKIELLGQGAGGVRQLLTVISNQ
jgi:hypothetical protein